MDRLYYSQCQLNKIAIIVLHQLYWITLVALVGVWTKTKLCKLCFTKSVIISLWSTSFLCKTYTIRGTCSVPEWIKVLLTYRLVSSPFRLGAVTELCGQFWTSAGFKSDLVAGQAYYYDPAMQAFGFGFRLDFLLHSTDGHWSWNKVEVVLRVFDVKNSTPNEVQWSSKLYSLVIPFKYLNRMYYLWSREMWVVIYYVSDIQIYALQFWYRKLSPYCERSDGTTVLKLWGWNC